MKASVPKIAPQIAIVVPVSAKAISGGAELLYQGLKNALNKSGYNARLIELVVDESSFEHILKAYEQFENLDLSHYDAVISTKSPSYAIQHKNHLCYLLHTIRVFYDRFDDEMKPTAFNKKCREQIIQRDNHIFKRLDNLLTIGHEVTLRLMKYNNIYHSQVLHPPLTIDHFNTQSYDNFAFIPSRLHRWKKIDFLINAWQQVNSDIKLYIAGTGEDEAYFKKLAANDERIHFLGKINDQELADYYSKCLFVPFAPINEDYGFVTLEAFRSKKMVLSCDDSGEPANMIINNINGYVVPRDEKAFAAQVDLICTNKNKTKQLGEQAYALSEKINWQNTIQEITKRCHFDKQ